jgi:hypothetical protein
LDLKTDSYGLVIYASKSPRRFLVLGLKIKQSTVYRLRHKTVERIKTVRGTHRDLMAYYGWNQVGLGFPSLPQTGEARQWMVHVAPSQRLHEDQAENERVDAIGCVGHCYRYFAVFIILGSSDILVFYPIKRTLEDMAPSYFSIHISYFLY